jgi:hypothetical protein
LSDVTAVVAMAVRLLVRHWPVLVVLFLAGVAARELIMWTAVKASKVNGVLGVAVVVLAPMATLTAFILMLRTIRPSLPWLTGPTSRTVHVDGGADRPGPGLLTVLGSVLIPFLTVYASYGQLKGDVSDYVYRVWFDETWNNPDSFTNPGNVNVAERLPFTFTIVLGSVVAVAVVLRWLLSRWEGTRRRGWLGILGAYVELIWLTLVVIAVSAVTSTTWDWIQSRRVIRWVQDTWDGIVDTLGPIGKPIGGAVSYLAGLLGSVDAVFVIPVAWLAVGAVVYGHRIAPPGPPAHELYQRAVERWSAVPKPVSRVSAELGASFRERFGPLFHGLRLLWRAGLGPMLLFCLAFGVAQTASYWLWELERLLIGPRDTNAVWRTIGGPLSTMNAAVSTVLLACLLGAAIDRVLRVQQGQDADPEPPRQPSQLSQAPPAYDGDAPTQPQPVVSLA